MPARVTCLDSFDLPLSRIDAFRLFTARGEQLWVPGWKPRFFGGGIDDLNLGTVWTTDDDTGRPVTWMVIDADPPTRVRYARVIERWTAGSVAVALTETTSGCRVTVEYDLTALGPDAEAELERFDAGYAAYLESWRDLILAHLASGGPMPEPV